MPDYAKKLKTARARLGLSQTQLADRLTKITGQRVTRLIVAYWEQGRTEIPVPRLLLEAIKDRLKNGKEKN